jgi:adenine deaminase
MESVKGRLVDIAQEKIMVAEIIIQDGKISAIIPLPEPGAPRPEALPSGDPAPRASPLSEAAAAPLPYILPGFIDAHVHIESSLLIPSEFARLAVVHGTVATVSDPHEIANVCGLPGVEFMIANGRTVPFHFNFGAPSCVPATVFETAGASLDAAAVGTLLKMDEIKYLSEMMNFPGVLHKDPEVMKKIASAHALGKPVDGHAPGLRGEQARQYIAAGISTDHECFTAEEALDKLRGGMKILIREGSAAKNFEALIGLLNDYPNDMMFCSDDKHPDSLIAGHIDRLCARAVAKGIDPFKILRAACLNPVLHYRLDTGLLRIGDPADLILVEDLRSFRVLRTYIKGELVAENGVSKIGPAVATTSAPAPTASAPTPINQFNGLPKVPADFATPQADLTIAQSPAVLVIEALDGQLITNRLVVPAAALRLENGLLQANPEKDILKIVVVNRYRPAPVAKAFIRNFGLKKGALASSVAHDSHNIVAVGADDDSICRAVNLIIEQKGGLSCVDPSPSPASDAHIPAVDEHIPAVKEAILPLPVGGLMSMDDGYRVAEAYTAIDAMAKGLGSKLSSPFMTLSFMALLVIPHVKLGDLGLFDGDKFELINSSSSSWYR